MKQLLVTAFSRVGGKNEPRGVRMHAILNNGKLQVNGQIPPGLRYVFPRNLKELSQKEAELWFYLLAGTKYPSRSRVEFTGTNKEAVGLYLAENLTEDELMRVIKGVPLEL